MSFSASPLLPGQTGQDDIWSRAAAAVVSAVTRAISQVPSATALRAGEPIADPTSARLPDPAGSAVTAYLGGGAEGTVLLVVGQELVDALSGTPFGTVEPAQALKPALETVAEGLGGSLHSDATGIGVEGCLEVLASGTTVLVPLLATGDGASGDAPVAALVGVSLKVLPAVPTSGVADGPASGDGPAAATPAAPASPPAAGAWGIDLLRDVEMEVTCELGRTRMTVRQLLALAPGDVVELDRLAGAPADLLVNGTLLARGEVVVVDESFGLRITEIVTQDAT